MKISVILLILLLFWIPAFTQILIPRVGFSSSMIEYTYGPSRGEYLMESSKKGFVVGIAADFSLLKYLSIQPELCFINKGVNQLYETPDIDSNSTMNINYIELPVLAKFKLGSSYFILGPAFSYGIGGTYKQETWDDYQTAPPRYFYYETNLGFTQSITGRVGFGQCR
jgi:Outer membrane protein beta-barrel domain